jgi:hypothetical protein
VRLHPGFAKGQTPASQGWHQARAGQGRRSRHIVETGHKFLISCEEGHRACVSNDHQHEQRRSRFTMPSQMAWSVFQQVGAMIDSRHDPQLQTACHTGLVTAHLIGEIIALRNQRGEVVGSFSFANRDRLIHRIDQFARRDRLDEIAICT